MSVLWVGIAIVVATLVVLLFADGRRREHAIARDWQLALTHRGQQLLDRVEGEVRDELAVAGVLHARAGEARARGDLVDAYRLIDGGCAMIAAFAPRMVTALAAWSVLSRMASAIAPVRPLRPADFQLVQLVQLAQLGRFVHHLLAGTAERFRWRVFLLQRGFRTVGGLATRWRGAAPLPEWRDVDAVHHDVGTLSAESLGTFKTLLVSLDAERKEGRPL